MQQHLDAYFRFRTSPNYQNIGCQIGVRVIFLSMKDHIIKVDSDQFIKEGFVVLRNFVPRNQLDREYMPHPSH